MAIAELLPVQTGPSVPAHFASTPETARAHRFDGRTAVVAVRTPHGWRRVRRTRWTVATVLELRERTVSEVVLRRGLRSVRLPLAWLHLPAW